MIAVAALLATVVVPSEEPSSATVRVVATRAGVPWPDKALGALRVVARAEEGPPSLRVQAGLWGTGAAVGELALSPGKWRVQAQGDGVWSAEQVVDVAPGRSELSVRIWPTARLVVHLPGRTSASAAPKAARAYFRGVPTEPEATRVPADGLDCRIVRTPAGSDMSCDVPAGAIDVRLTTSGCVPSYHWDMTLRPGESRGLGSLRPAAASIVGYVQDDKGIPVAGAAIELQTQDGRSLVPVRRVSAPGEEEPAPATPSLVSRTNHRGFFQMVGMAPAEYRVVASGGSGLIAMASVHVEQDLETALRDFLVLQAPYPLEVSVEPPTGPAGQPWSLSLIKLSPFQAKTEHPVPETGTLRLPSLTQGHYLLELMAGDGEKWLSKDITVDRPPGPLLLKVPIVHVRGTIRLRRDPLKASLTFGGRHGKGGLVVLHSDERGEFEGHLPRGGGWPLHVSSSDPPVERALDNVEVETDASGHEGSLDLQLQDGRLKGRVVDEAGGGLRAIVNLSSKADGDEPLNQVFTDSEGRFELRGLAEYLVVLEARAYRRRSQTLAMVLSHQTTEVTLVAREVEEFDGRLLAADTGLPIPGIRVILIPVGRPRTAAGENVDTDHEGRFRFSMPAGTEAATFYYAAGDRPFEMGLVRLTPGSPVTLKAAPAGGLLTVELPTDVDHSRMGAPLAVLLHDGASFTPALARGVLLLRKGMRPPAVTGVESRVVVPNLAAGDYALCWFGYDVYNRNPALPFDASRCTSGSLPVGGELTLSLKDLKP